MLRFDASKLRPVMESAFADIAMAPRSAELAVASMIETSLRGVDSHGINLFPHYHAAAQSARINPRPALHVSARQQACATLDADHAIGHHAGAVAMELACELASAHGIGAVAVRDSTHFGAAGFFALRAARGQQHLGLAFTNADALVKAFGARRAVFGTNPICLAAPMVDEDPLCIDLATSGVSWNKVKNHRRSGEALLPGWAYDAAGDPTTDPNAARMLEPSGGYKGYALGMMVELLCGMLSDGPVATEILPMFTAPLSERRHISHFFMALHIDHFVESGRFRQRLSELARAIRALGSRPGQVMVPGDPEKAALSARTLEGIPVFDDVFEQFMRISPQFQRALIA